MQLAQFKDYKENDQLRPMSMVGEAILVDACNKIRRSSTYGSDMKSSQYACLVDAKKLIENALELMVQS